MNLYQTLKNKFKRHGLLSYLNLVELINAGVINAPLSAINGSSIDLTLHHLARREVFGPAMQKVRLGQGESIETKLLLEDKYSMTYNSFYNQN
jgi:hypothetical protein